MQHDTCTNTTLIEAFMGTIYSRHPHDLQPGTPDKIVNVLENYAESRKVKDFGSRTFIFQFDPSKIIKELRSELRNIDGFNQLVTETDIIADIVDRCDPNERCFICPAKNYCGNKNGDYAPWMNRIDIDECKNTVKEWANKEV